MDRVLEAKEIEEVRARLAERFPQLDEEVIEAAVRLAHSELTGGIRDFVPVLVEHNARDRLAAIAEQQEGATEDDSASHG
jgi:hypothetical protein